MKKSTWIVAVGALAAILLGSAIFTMTRGRGVDAAPIANTPHVEAIVPSTAGTPSAPGAVGERAAAPVVPNIQALTNPAKPNPLPPVPAAALAVPPPPAPPVEAPKGPAPDRIRDRPGNQEPVANNDWYTVQAGQLAEFRVLQNDYDPDEPAQGAEGVYLVTYEEGPPHGALNLLGGQYFTYRAPLDYAGSFQFRYVLTDGDEKFGLGWVTVVVQPAPPGSVQSTSSTTAPPPQQASTTTTQGPATTTSAPALSAPVANGDRSAVDNRSDGSGMTMIDVLANDFGPGGQPDGRGLVILRFSQPRGGSVTLDNGRYLTYRPNMGFAGEDRFEYVVQANDGRTAAAAVAVTVTHQQPPTTIPPTSTTTTAPAWECSAWLEGSTIAVAGNRGSYQVTVTIRDTSTGMASEEFRYTDPDGSLRIDRPAFASGEASVTGALGNGCAVSW